jgi:FAD/FMN-containing dehydrogenase
MTFGTLPQTGVLLWASDEDEEDCAVNRDVVHACPAPEPQAAAYQHPRRPSFTHGHGQRRPLLFALLWTLLGGAAAELGTSGHDLSNFQGKHACDARVRMAAPRTPREVSEVVTSFPRVRANGVGHSWHRGLFCAGEDTDSVNILTHRLRSVGAGASPSDRRRRLAGSGAAWGSESPVADRVRIDTSSMTVTVDAGVILRDLLDHLANHDDPTADEDQPMPLLFGDALFRGTQRGYTLAAFPWFIDQTIAGAVATATHGSSLRHGSISSQTVAVTIVLANGTLARYQEGDKAFEAVRASVGRLGVVVDVTLKIVPNTAVRKTSVTLTPRELVDAVSLASNAAARCQDTFPLAGDVRAWDCMRSDANVRRLDETQVFWHFPLGKAVRTDFTRLDAIPGFPTPANLVPYRARRQNDNNGGLEPAWIESGVRTNSVDRLNGLVRAQPPDAPRDITDTDFPLMANDTFSRFWSRQWDVSTALNTRSGVDDARDAYLSMSEEQYDAHDNYGYDQYEVCVPLRLAGGCLGAIADDMEAVNAWDPVGFMDPGPGNLANGFRSPALIRFTSPDSALLSPSNLHAAGACMYVNVEDYVRHATTPVTVNRKFQKVIEHLRGPSCDGRLHWGKAGWPTEKEWEGSFDGATEYGAAWCSFGCIVHALDPNGKFSGVSDAMTWPSLNASRCCGGDEGLEYLADVDGCECARVGSS